MKKKRTMVIGISTWDDIVKDVSDAAKKSKRGQSVGVVDSIDFADQATLFNTLSPKRMELLRYLRRNGPMSGRQLAKVLTRDQKNIQTDIKLLSRLGLITNDKEGKYQVPWDDITIQLALAA